MKASRVLRKLLLLMLVCALVWCAVVVYWRATDAHPSSTDLVLYLGVLPLGMVGSWWLLRSGIDRFKRAPTATAKTGDATSAASGGSAAASAEVVPEDIVVDIIASAIHVVAGTHPTEVAAALAEPFRPGLHPQLRDHAGLPVLAAHVDDLDTASMADALAACAGDDAQLSLITDERLRALALLDPVAEELLLAVLDTLPVANADAPARGRDALAPALRIHLLLPATWPAAARQVAATWMQDKATTLGLANTSFTVEVVPATDASDVWQAIASINRSSRAAANTQGDLLLTADSRIGEAAIERLQAQGRLTSARHPEGVIPGEGAAGLWLAASHSPSHATIASPRLHRVTLQRREHTTTQTRATIRQLGALLQRSLATSKRVAADIAMVISDADQRPSRAQEIAGVASDLFPEIDPLRQCLNLGVACGDTGIVAPLAVLSIASAQATADTAPVAVVGLADELLAALIVSPANSHTLAVANDAALTA